MNTLSTLYLLAAVAVFSLGALVLIKNPRQPVNRIFSLLCLSTFIWQFFYFLMLNSPADRALTFARIGHAAVPFIPLLYLHFVIKILKIRRITPILIVLYSYALLSAILTITTDLYLQNMKAHAWGLYPEGNLMMFFDFIICGAICTSAAILLIRGYYRAKKYADTFQYLYKIKYVLLGLMAFSLAIIDYLPKLFIFPIDIFPVGSIMVIVFASITSYAFLKHNLLDVNIVIRKGLVYSILVTSVTVLYFVIVYLAETIFRGFIGYRSVPLTLAIVTSFILLFQPLKNKIQLFVDKFFFKKTREALARENERLMEEIRRTDRLKAVATLAAGMAHEIKNPLTSIKTFTDYIDVKYGDKEFRKKFKRIVGGEVDRINAIVGQLLDYAKPRLLSLQKIDINKLLEETLALLSNDFIKRRIEVIRGYGAKEFSVIKADPNQLKQVFLNIFLNAMDSMSEGGKLVIGTKKSDDEECLEITIEDTGGGIAEKDLSHIFDPFYSTKESGAGLGLSIVHGIIKEHGGSITCESSIGKGAKFIITLPKLSL